MTVLFNMLILMIAFETQCSRLIDTAVFIAESEFDSRQITLILRKCDDTGVDMNVTEVLMKYPGSVATASINNTIHDPRYLFFVVRVTQTIFVATKPEDFDFMAKVVKQHVVIPLRAILILVDPVVDVNLVNKATNSAWENDIGDIVVLTQTSHNEDIKYWTFFPFGNGECGNTTAIELDLKTNTGFYPRKFINFHGCPIRITLLHFLPYVLLEKENDTVTSIRGIDGMTLNLVMEKLNASFDIVYSTDHGGIGAYINGSGTGSFGDLINDVADIFSPAIMINAMRYPIAQTSYVYKTQDIYWFGPNRREIHAWAKILLPFFTSITPFILLTSVVFIAVTKFIRRYDLCQVERKKGIFFMTFAMFLGQEVNFETKCLRTNSLFVMWIWFCMIVRIDLQGDLVEGLQKVILEPPLGELDEALTKVDSYGGVEIFRQFYKNTDLGNKFQVLSLPEVPTKIREISEGKRFLLVTDILLVKWFRKNLQVLEKPLTKGAVCLYMRAGWPAADEVRIITYRIAETGLIQKIIDDFQFDWFIQSSDQSKARKMQPLSMTTLGACFYGLLFMCLVCFAIFCGEILCYKYELKNKLKRKFNIK